MSTPFHGTLFDGETLAATPVTLHVTEGRISSQDETTVLGVAATEVRVSDRLGNTPRYLYLPDGRTVETTDNEAVDALLTGQRRGRLVALIHVLETRSRMAATATVLLVATVGATIWWGLPALAYRIAMAVPDRIEQQAGRTALATVNQILASSELSAADRNRVMIQMKRLTRAAGLPAAPEVVFRSMGGQFPNAFALPGGIIVMSDELVKLAVDDELAAVLAHEIGHWQYRHGTQSVLRGSTALLVVSAVTGDLSALTTFAGTIPFVLLQRGYSREFETQADRYAVDLLRRAGIGSHHFASILRKLEATRPKQGNDYTYLSTHPGTDDRIKQIEATSSPLLPGAGASSLPHPDAALLEDKVIPSGERTDIQPRALIRPAPRYPADMALARVRGRVTVEFIIDSEGNVRNALVMRSNYKEFEEPALTAVRQWKYTPGQRQGRPVAVRVSQLLEFNVDDGAIPPAPANKTFAPEVPPKPVEPIPPP